MGTNGLERRVEQLERAHGTAPQRPGVLIVPREIPLEQWEKWAAAQDIPYAILLPEKRASEDMGA